MKGNWIIRASERWFRLLLRLYPVDFRDEHGNALVEAYQDRAREVLSRGGAIGLTSVWLRALVDSLRNGPGERLHPAASWRRRSGDWGRDLELAHRRLVRAPIFVAATIGTLTVGLGTFAVIYTAVDKILLEPLPYRDPANLYMVWASTKDLPRLMISGDVVAEFQKGRGAIEDGSALQTGSVTLSGSADQEAIRIDAVACSTNLFDLLGVRPILGRNFQPHEEGPNAPRVVVLSNGLWKRLGGDPGIIGDELYLSSTPYTVIGVMPPNFRFTASYRSVKADVFFPFDFHLASQTGSNYRALIRARRGTSPEQVQLAVDAVGRSVEEGDFKGRGITLYSVGFQEDLVREVRPALLALGGAAVLLVLVLTVNLASLLLARSAEREREYAVSRALGANGFAVVRATLVEGGLLGLMGGTAGALVGIWGTRLLLTLTPANLPRRETIVMDGGVAAVVITVGLLLGLMAAIVPATWAARVSLASLLSATAVRGAASSGRMRRALIASQVAMSLVVLNTGAVVVRSFERLLAAEPGFNPKGALTFRVGIGDGILPNAATAFAFLDQVDAALRALPGVTAVSATTRLPLSGGGNVADVMIPGAPGNTGDPEKDRPTVLPVFVRGGYVEAMGMRLLDGRGFDLTHRNGVSEALIDRHLAQQFFPRGSPLGAILQSGGRSLTIVGVVEQARLFELHKDDPNPQLFMRAEDARRLPSFYVVRTDTDPHALIPAVQTIVRQIDRRVPLSDVRTMEEIVADSHSQERISAVLISVLGLGALLLVAMGLFGVISGTVTRRRRELAVRLALGATHHRVLRLVLAEGGLLVIGGVLLGAPGIYAAGGLIRGLLIDVSPWDPLTLLAVALGLGLVAMAACYVPARRVLGIDPAPLLRQE